MQRAYVRDLTQADLEAVHRILTTWIREPTSQKVLLEEVSTTLVEMRDAFDASTDRRFWVAVSEDGSISGLIGMRPPSREMQEFAQGKEPIEIIHAFVRKGFQNQGLGTLLVQRVEDEAKRNGFDEVLVNSGPRYSKSWAFYDRLGGFERRGMAKDYYGPGQHARVWGKLL